MLETIVQDVRYATRVLRKSPLFTATAALSLAIGIAANTTIFSVASALLLRPLPGLARPDRLVDIGRTQEGQGFDTISFPYYRDLRERLRTLEGVYAYRPEPQPMSLGGRGDAERIYGTIVTANYFEILGVRPALGRLLQDADDRIEGNAIVVLSHDLWQRRFGSDRSIVGQTITINSHMFVVVGVAERDFQGTTLLKPDAWVPVTAMTYAAPRLPRSLMTERRSVWLLAGGRLADGVTLAQANAELNSIGTALEREFPKANRGKNVRAAITAIVPGQTSIVGGFLAILMALVGLVLLIACVNVASMLLARAATRRREVAVRLAIGAGRSRLIRQLLTETLLLFALGGGAGLLLTNWLTRVLVALLPELPIPVFLDLAVDWRVALFAAGISLVAAVVFGLAPALQASRAELVPALKTDGLDSGPLKLRLRNAFVVGQVAMSLMLVVAAGLLLRSLQHAADIQPGFDERGVEVVSLDLSLAAYDEHNAEAFMRELLARARATPGIESASAAVDLPLDGNRMSMGGLRVPGVEPPGGGRFFSADWNIVEPGYFRALRLPLVRGRDFTDADTAAAPAVAIVNEAMANRFWPGQDPIGKQVFVEEDRPDRPVTVVGVASDAQLISLGAPAEPFIYAPFAQRFLSRVSIVVRTTGRRSAIPQIREIMRSLNGNLPVSQAMPLSEVTAIGLVPQRIAAAVAGSLGIVGLVLAAIGIYGVTAYAVARRTREIGIRVALGADRGDVVRLVLRQGLGLAAIGVAIGVVVAGVASQLLRSLLFGVAGLDPITFAGACVLFGLVTLAASYLPARRAVRIEGAVALRAE